MILDEIAQRAIGRVQSAERQIPLSRIRAEAEKIAETELNTNGKFLYPFKNALKADGISFICEVKKASPSKGVIAQDFPYLQIAKEYEEAGAAALSVLTEPYYFKGSNSYLKEIAAEVKLPVLRKDFTVSPYMIYEAKALGASAILLICTILSDKQLKEYIEISNSLGLSAVVEVHTTEEVKRAVDNGASIVGVNNRNLQNFNVDITTSLRLRSLVPENIVYVSESGIKTAEDIAALCKIGADAVLIGETLMRSTDKKAALSAIKCG